MPGIHSAKEALKVRPQEVLELLLVQGWENHPELSECESLARGHRMPTKVVSASVLDRICSTHQGVVARVASSPKFDWPEELTQEDSAAYGRTYLALDGITDPQNLGAIMRTAWLMGVQGVFLPERRAAHLTPAAIKVASGGAEHVPVEVVDSLPKALETLKNKGFWVYGLSAEGAVGLWQQEFAADSVIVVGAEDRGLRPGVEKICDQLVSIPQVDVNASYNASVAAALVMAEVTRQRKNR